MAGVRELGITPHMAAKDRFSAIDGRTTRHAGYAVSQRRRKLVEEPFGWMKTIGGLRKLRHRGKAKVAAMFTFACAVSRCCRSSSTNRREPTADSKRIWQTISRDAEEVALLVRSRCPSRH